jgi:hypothetical protein
MNRGSPGLRRCRQYSDIPRIASRSWVPVYGFVGKGVWNRSNDHRNHHRVAHHRFRDRTSDYCLALIAGAAIAALCGMATIPKYSVEFIANETDARRTLLQPSPQLPQVRIP